MEKWIDDYWKLVDKSEKAIKTLTGKLRFKNDDDYIDRLSSRYTTYMLFWFTLAYIIICYSIKSTITCLVPVHITGSQTKYINSYCWVRNTYYVPMNESLPKPNEPREHVIPYYQWVPFILLGQAMLFYLPSLFWHGLNQQGGVDCDSILESAHKLTDQLLGSGSEYKDNLLRMINNQMHRFLDNRRKKQRAGMKCSIGNVVNTLCQPCKHRFGNYLVVLFLFSKVLYLVNVIGQLFLLNMVLATRYHLYGFEIMEYLLSDADWTESPGVVFPRVTHCDFDIRRLGNNHRYTVQCALPLNMHTEKIYMFLWFWMVFLTVVTILGIIVWTMRAISSSDKVKFISNHLMDITELEKKMVPDFVGNYLGHDGVFILRLIAHNTNNITVTEIVNSLFVMYKKKTEST